jgi:hypothetical protein
MHTINITRFPYNDSPSLDFIIKNSEYKISSSDFNEFIRANNNFLNQILINITSNNTCTINQGTRFFKSMYKIITVDRILPIIRQSGFSYIYSSTSTVMNFIVKQLHSGTYSPYIREGMPELTSDLLANVMWSNIPSSISPMYTSKYNKANYSEEPSNTEEKVVNTVELAILLATSRLKEQGLIIEKEKEKFTRIVNDYTSLIDKCVSTKDDDSHAKKEEYKEMVKDIEEEGPTESNEPSYRYRTRASSHDFIIPKSNHTYTDSTFIPPNPVASE